MPFAMVLPLSEAEVDDFWILADEMLKLTVFVEGWDSF